MFSISFPDGLLLLEVEANDRFIRLFYRFLLLHACGGITVSMRVRVVSGEHDNVEASRRRRGRERHAIEAIFRPRRGPKRLKISQKNTQRLL